MNLLTGEFTAYQRPYAHQLSQRACSGQVGVCRAAGQVGRQRTELILREVVLDYVRLCCGVAG